MCVCTLTNSLMLVSLRKLQPAVPPPAAAAQAKYQLSRTICMASPLERKNNALSMSLTANNNVPLSSMRIKIHGTKNAFTTIRSNDIVLYQLENQIDGLDKSIGLYKSGLIYPLLAKDAKREIFLLDSTQEPLDAEVMGRKNRILRMISSDTFSGLGIEAYKVDEYIDDSVYIKLYNENSAEDVQIESLNERAQIDVDSFSDNKDIDDTTKLILAELNVAKLELKVCFISLIFIEKVKLITKFNFSL